MHEEMARVGGQEFRTPVIQSTTLWQQTGRLQQCGPMMLLRLNDRAERALIFAPTHEEAVTQLAFASNLFLSSDACPYLPDSHWLS